MKRRIPIPAVHFPALATLLVLFTLLLSPTLTACNCTSADGGKTASSPTTAATSAAETLTGNTTAKTVTMQMNGDEKLVRQYDDYFLKNANELLISWDGDGKINEKSLFLFACLRLKEQDQLDWEKGTDRALLDGVTKKYTGQVIDYAHFDGCTLNGNLVIPMGASPSPGPRLLLQSRTKVGENTYLCRFFTIYIGGTWDSERINNGEITQEAFDRAEAALLAGDPSGFPDRKAGLIEIKLEEKKNSSGQTYYFYHSKRTLQDGGITLAKA